MSGETRQSGDGLRPGEGAPGGGPPLPRSGVRRDEDDDAGGAGGAATPGGCAPRTGTAPPRDRVWSPSGPAPRIATTSPASSPADEHTGAGPRVLAAERNAAAEHSVAQPRLTRRRGAGSWRLRRYVPRSPWTRAVEVVLLAVGGLGVLAVSTYVFLYSLGGPGYTVATPAQAGGLIREVGGERGLAGAPVVRGLVAQLRRQGVRDLVHAVYRSPGLDPVSGTPQRVFFIGGLQDNLLWSAAEVRRALAPSAELLHAEIVETDPGPLGGSAACVSGGRAGTTVGLCAWADGHTLGALCAPSGGTSTHGLADLLRRMRPDLERPVEEGRS